MASAASKPQGPRQNHDFHLSVSSLGDSFVSELNDNADVKFEDVQKNVRLSMAGQVYTDGKRLKASDDTASFDKSVDEESLLTEPRDMTHNKAAYAQPKHSPGKTDPPDEKLGDDTQRDETIIMSNAGLGAPARRSRKEKEKRDLDNPEIIGEKGCVDSDSVSKGDWKNCIILLLSALIILAYGGGVYTGVVISSGRDRSMHKITPEPTQAPTRQPSVGN